MGHKADRSFFEHKRPWSKRKDVILEYYLEAYVPKVRKLRRPVLLVDGFAGPGRFDDGEPGSPVIICSKAQAANETPGPPVRVWCIEPEPELFSKLQENVAFPFAVSKKGEFLDYVDEIRQFAQTGTVFLYVDPYAAADVDWAALDGISEQIRRSDASVELLMNFNTPNFVRWGLAALEREVPRVDETAEDPDEADAPTEPPGHERLNAVVGGSWWRDVLGANQPFEQLVEGLATHIGAALRERYEHVCWLPIKRRQEHRVPKYHMFFGSRHPDALELMNDAMVKARGTSDFEIDLFAEQALDGLILKQAPDWVPRGDLILDIIRNAFCRFYRKDIRGRIECLLKAGRLVSETGKWRINNTVAVKRP
jgi:three-Cys-motif partner protein